MVLGKNASREDAGFGIMSGQVPFVLESTGAQDKKLVE